MTIRLQSDTNALQTMLRGQRVKGRTIGFVPTMGFLHRGHQSLIEASHKDGNFTVVSIFVNPAQFGPDEDFDRYPIAHDRDFELARESGADLVWYPHRHDLFHPEAQTVVRPGALAQRLCGISRPAFFGGICTVVLKFFNLVQPHTTYFGEKDFQQLAIIRRMVSDFYLNIDVVGCPLIREADGLAMSSRNARLEPDERQTALTLYRTLQAARAAFAGGERRASELKAQLKQNWPNSIELDYLDFREPRGLEEVEKLEGDTRCLIGAWLRDVRLIDNDVLG